MAKNFGNAGAAKTFASVERKSAEKAQVAVIRNIAAEYLIDNPENGEDIDDTQDLELSIRENGFTDPIEVTDFGMGEGMYMILSGHRRRAAGVKAGMDVFPALVRHFDDRKAMINYMLLSNSQRDSAKDPFLFAKRYKMHEQYLAENGFAGSKREEIARRLGLSVQQADRYSMMNKVILPVWDMVAAEKVGMSSVVPLASHSESEQKEVYGIMQEALSSGVALTREAMKMIIEKYREGKRMGEGITEGRQPKINGATDAEKDMHEKRADNIIKSLHRLESNLLNKYKCRNEDVCQEMVEAMGNVAITLIHEMRSAAEQYGKEEASEKKIRKIKELV